MLAKPFVATAQTKVVVPSAVSQLAALDNLSIGSQMASALVQNNSSVDIAVAPGDASAVAVFPTAAAPQKAYVIVAGGGLIITTPMGTTHFAVIGSGAGSGNVYITPGFGL